MKKSKHQQAIERELESIEARLVAANEAIERRSDEYRKALAVRDSIEGEKGLLERLLNAPGEGEQTE